MDTKVFHVSRWNDDDTLTLRLHKPANTFRFPPFLVVLQMLSRVFPHTLPEVHNKCRDGRWAGGA